MITFDFKFDNDGFNRKILAGAEKDAMSKLRKHGISTVIVRALRLEGSGVRFEFSGPAADVKKAKAIFGIG